MPGFPTPLPIFRFKLGAFNKAPNFFKYGES